MVYPSALGRLLVLVLILGFWSSTQAATDVLRSPNDSRQYEAFELPNKLRVLLVSDPDTDKAAAALDVRVGSGSNPPNREGLAHFLEHMLFLGTEKYPQAGEYQKFISAHGGTHNAYTAFDHTNYFFDIDEDYLEPALDRFAQFFIAPLFTAEYVNRERAIVDSEYQSKRQDDNWRNLHVFKRILNPTHPFARFSVGSSSTLEDRRDSTIRDELIAFYQKHYSANLMALVVLGKEPLPVLRRWVTEKFSSVKNIEAKSLEIDTPLFSPGSLPARLDVVPNKDERSLTLTFPISAMEEHYRTKPTLYVSNLLGHEGQGSLLSLLKRRGWGNGLIAGRGMTIDREATFYVTVQLTESGFDHIPEITSAVFEYIRLIQATGVVEWLFDEQRRLAEIGFRFQEKSAPIRYVRTLASNLHKYPIADVVRGPYVMDQYDSELIHELLRTLTPNNVLLTVMGKELVGDRVEPWFGTSYRFATLENFPEEATETDGTLALPKPNIFLPDDLTAKPAVSATSKPELIKEDKMLALWHQQDDTYRVPRADFYFSVRSPLANDSPKHAVLTELYVKLVNDQLNEFAYPAQLAGLTYNLYNHMRGFSVRISGYSDKQAPLLLRLAKTLRQPKIEPMRFAVFKDQLNRRLENAAKQSPYTQALTELQTLLLQPSWDETKLLAALRPLQAKDLMRFLPKLLANINVVVLSHGNVHRSEAIALASALESALLEDAAPTVVPRGKVVKLNADSKPVRRLYPGQQDSAVAVYFQGDDRRFITRARFGLLAQILAGPFFHELRTEGQLGYVVFTSAMPILEAPGIVFVVQSPVADPVDLTNHVQHFIAGFTDQLAAMPDAVFANHKAALITRILEKEKSLQERSDRYWDELDNERLEFDSREQLAAAVRTINKQAFRDFFNRSLLGQHSKRLVIQALGSRHKNAVTESENGGLILNSETFKQGKKFFSG